MSLRFEAYSSTPSEEIDRRFVVVVYGEGRGKFSIKRNHQSDKNANTFVVSSVASEVSEAREEIFSSLPSAIETIFQEGALSITYVEGDALIEFPVEYAETLDRSRQATMAQLALSGLVPLARDFGRPLYVSEYEAEISKNALTALQLCVFVVLGISFITVYYGSSVVPIEWLGVSFYCLGFVLLCAVIFRNFSRGLFETGKVFTICFMGCISILFMLLIGVASREFYSDSIESREGIIETVLAGSKYNVMRVRLASNPNTSFLISKDFLKHIPERMPQAAMFRIRVGLFGTRYVNDLELIE